MLCIYITVYNINMKILYSKFYGDYGDWQEQMWLKYNTPISEVAKKLNVSREWITHYLLKEINYVVYHNKFIYNKTLGRELTYVSLDELGEWIAQNATFERQTEIVDLYSYLSSNKKKRSKIYKEYNEEMKRLKLNKGTIPEITFNTLRENYHLGFNPKNCTPTQRNKYPFVKVKGFNIFEKDYYFVEGVAETIYRKTFLNGDIKVKIKGKTLFIKSSYPEYKMPFVIPYDQSMILYERGRS